MEPNYSDEIIARPASEYVEEMGDVLWWRFPIKEPPYCGSPNDTGYPVAILKPNGEQSKPVFVGGWVENYYTHFTPIKTPSRPCAVCERQYSAYGTTHDLCQMHLTNIAKFWEEED